MHSNLQPVAPEELMAYLDGELPVDRAAAVAAHVQECRECQILAAELKSVSESLSGWNLEVKEPQIGAELAKALDEREHQTQPPESGGGWNWLRSWRSWRFGPWVGGAFVGGAAALLLAFTLTFSLDRSENRPAPKAPVAERATPRPQTSANSSTAAMMEQDSGVQYNRVSPAPVGDRDSLAAPLTDAAETAKRSRVQISSNLEPAARITAVPNAPMILRTAQLTVVTQDLERARAGLDTIVQKYSGYVGNLSASAPSDGPRKLTATLRVPAAQLDAALAEVKKLGRVESESQNGQDVTAQYVDLESRLGNSRNTEQRLLDLLRQRTGKLSDVLEVETELSRVREEIEGMEGERRLLSKQVEYATLTATLREEFKSPAGAVPDSLGTRFRNAAMDGYQSVVSFVIGIGLFLVSNGPMLVLWAAILFFPVRFAWRRRRNR